jgi:hypothetical protein
MEECHMSTIQTLCVIPAFTAGLILATAALANAQVQFSPWLPMVPSATEPYTYYHPLYQPYRSTAYYFPPYVGYAYPYSYPYRYRTYLYVPSRRPFYTWMR